MTYIPAPSLITNITNAVPGIVTTSTNHGLLTGQVVRLIVPIVFGMTQLNNALVVITTLTPKTFSIYKTLVPPIAIDTRNFYPFVAATGLLRQVAQVIPVGEASLLTDAAHGIFESPINDQLLNVEV